MNLDLPNAQTTKYKSSRHIVRVSTELWGEQNLYCPNCSSDVLRRTRVGMPAVDYTCPVCESGFQLKSQAQRISNRVPDAEFATMKRAIEQDEAPNLVLLHYDANLWKVLNLLLIPRFAFSMSAVEKRKPTIPKGRKTPWVGCTFVLTNIPPSARISLITDCCPRHPALVRKEYSRLKPIAEVKIKSRGWTLDVLNFVQSLNINEFHLADVYAFESALARLHPGNRHIRDKIRQQLQILRDMHLLDFLGGGSYRLT